MIFIPITIALVLAFPICIMQFLVMRSTQSRKRERRFIERVKRHSGRKAA